MHGDLDFSEEDFSDEELSEQALAADPTEDLAADAAPLAGSFRSDAGALPSWYMPAVASNVRLEGRRRNVALLVVAAFLLINTLGLSATYGFITIG